MFDLSKGIAAKEEGIERVLDNEHSTWRGLYEHYLITWFLTLPVGTTFLGEEMRAHAKKCGLHDPHHPNCWSGMARAMTKQWIREGRLTISGFRASRSVANCSHQYKEYMKV
jgi:hypothetical protein